MEEPKKIYVLKTKSLKMRVVGTPVKLMASPNISASRKDSASKRWRMLMDEYALLFDTESIDANEYMNHLLARYSKKRSTKGKLPFKIIKVTLENSGKVFDFDYEWEGLKGSITFANVRRYVRIRNKGIKRMKGNP